MIFETVIYLGIGFMLTIVFFFNLKKDKPYWLDDEEIYILGFVSIIAIIIWPVLIVAGIMSLIVRWILK
jgi:hypothetical protein